MSFCPTYVNGKGIQMPKHAVKLIINPNADLGRAWRWAADLRPVADEYGGADWTGTVYPTHATELAYQAAEEGYPWWWRWAATVRRTRSSTV